MPDVCCDYLGEVGELLRQRAEEAHQELRELRENSLEGREYAYRSGLLMGYREVLDAMMGQAEVFGIPLRLLGLDGFEPERLVIPQTPGPDQRTS